MKDDSGQSVTTWFHAVQRGDPEAARQLWNRYFERIIRLTERRLVHDPAYDREDLATSVLKSLFFGVGSNRFQNLANRDELWALLVFMAQRKLIDRQRYANAKKGKTI